MIRGIDVSAHQGTIDWKKVKLSGIDFAIIRMGYGSDINSQDDIRVIENCRGAERVGIKYGLYLYSYALTDEDVESEADHMIRIAKMVNPELGCFFDMEDADRYKQRNGINVYHSKAKLTRFCQTWLKKVAKAGFKVGTYANYDYLTRVLDLELLRDNGMIWLAHWGISKPSIECDYWQYTDKGTVSGINYRVDMNYGYMTENEPKKTPNKKDETKVEYYPAYTGKSGSIVDALKTLSLPFTKAARAKMAKANGIEGYTGTAEQNIKMLELLKAGKLIKGE